MSGKAILNLAVSLDGFIADERDGYDWIQPSGDPALNTEARWEHKEFLTGISAIVMGRRCYDQNMHSEYTDKQVYVVTSRPLPDHDNVHFLGGNPAAEILKLKQTAERDIYLFGGGLSIDPILKAGLIEEYVIGIIPILLGKGISLFLGNNPCIPLRLTHHYVEDGVVILRYVPREK